MSLAWAGVAALVGGLAQVRSYMFPSGLAAIGMAMLIEVLDGRTVLGLIRAYSP